MTPLSDASYLTAVWSAALVVLLGVIVALRSRQTKPAIERPEKGRMQSRVPLLYAATYTAGLVRSLVLVDAQTDI